VSCTSKMTDLCDITHQSHKMRLSFHRHWNSALVSGSGSLLAGLPAKAYEQYVAGVPSEDPAIAERSADTRDDGCTAAQGTAIFRDLERFG
jgi:hypothetical protein